MSEQFSRVKSLLGDSFAQMRNSTVGIVGLGSLGSLTTNLLAMSGVENFILVDPDILEEHNTVRHAADLRYVGQPKVHAVKNVILNRNRNAQVTAVHANIMDDLSVLDKADLVLVAGLGSEITTMRLAVLLREMGTVSFYGGLYEKGIAGEVFIVHPQIGPCYSCFGSILRTFEDVPNEKEVNYGMPPDEVKAQPGLGIHVNRVASVFADWSLRYLVKNAAVLPNFPGNLVILSNEAYTIGTDAAGKAVAIPPSSAWWKWIHKQQGCLICNLPEIETRSLDSYL